MYFTLCSWNWHRLFNIYIFSYLMIFMEGFLLTALVKHVSSNKIKMHKMEYPWHWHFRSNFFFFFFAFAFGSKQNKTNNFSWLIQIFQKKLLHPTIFRKGWDQDKLHFTKEPSTENICLIRRNWENCPEFMLS